jgi:hypothetical protein
MNRDGHNSVAFFIGPEVEHTPAYSKKTLFVVGRQSVVDIEKHARDNKTPHIFMGANHSFDIEPGHPDETVKVYWDKTITALLDKGFMVTLDYQAHMHETVLKMLNPGVWQSRLFVPLLAVRIPKIETSSPNLTVKIDDVDFKATNRGVWCMHFHEVTDSNRFTDWQDYETDSIIHTGVELMDSFNAKTEPKAKVAAPVAPAAPQPPAEEPVAETLNQTELGLDVVATTALKADPDAPPVADVVKTPEDAAAAYADGATVDPLSAEASKKPKSKK